jgi:hypothetical protein
MSSCVTQCGPYEQQAGAASDSACCRVVGAKQESMLDQHRRERQLRRSPMKCRNESEHGHHGWTPALTPTAAAVMRAVAAIKAGSSVSGVSDGM